MGRTRRYHISVWVDSTGKTRAGCVPAYSQTLAALPERRPSADTFANILVDATGEREAFAKALLGRVVDRRDYGTEAAR